MIEVIHFSSQDKPSVAIQNLFANHPQELKTFSLKQLNEIKINQEIQHGVLGYCSIPSTYPLTWAFAQQNRRWTRKKREDTRGSLFSKRSSVYLSF